MDNNSKGNDDSSTRGELLPLGDESDANNDIVPQRQEEEQDLERQNDHLRSAVQHSENLNNTNNDRATDDREVMPAANQQQQQQHTQEQPHKMEHPNRMSRPGSLAKFGSMTPTSDQPDNSQPNFANEGFHRRNLDENDGFQQSARYQQKMRLDGVERQRQLQDNNRQNASHSNEKCSQPLQEADHANGTHESGDRNDAASLKESYNQVQQQNITKEDKIPPINDNEEETAASAISTLLTSRAVQSYRDLQPGAFQIDEPTGLPTYVDEESDEFRADTATFQHSAESQGSSNNAISMAASLHSDGRISETRQIASQSRSPPISADSTVVQAQAESIHSDNNGNQAVRLHGTATLPSSEILVTATLAPDRLIGLQQQQQRQRRLQEVQERAQEEARREFYDNIVNAERTEVLNNDNDAPENGRLLVPAQKNKHRTIFALIIMAAVGIVIGSVMGTRCRRNPNASGCSAAVSDPSQSSGDLFQNDNCGSAFQLYKDATRNAGSTFTTDGATPDDYAICPNDESALLDPGIWFVIDGSGIPLEVGIRSSSSAKVDKSISIFTGECNTPVCVNSEHCENDCSLAWQTSIGTIYRILVRSAEPIAFFVDIRETAQNDVCDAAIAISINNSARMQQIEGSTSNSSLTKIPASCSDLQGPSRIWENGWYAVKGTGLPLRVSTCLSTSVATRVDILSGECNRLICVAETTKTFECGSHDEIIWSSIVGKQYYIVVSSDPNGPNQDFTLTVSESTSNDFCETATRLDLQKGEVTELSISTETATKDVVPNCIRGRGSILGHGVWYEVNSPDSLLELSVIHSEDESIHIFEGSCNQLVCVSPSRASTEVRDDGRSKSRIAWLQTSGQRHFVFVIRSGSFVEGDTEVTIGSYSKNSICETATSLDLDSFGMIADSTTTALGPSRSLSKCGAATEVTSPGVWYKFVGRGSLLRASTCMDDLQAGNASYGQIGNADTDIDTDNDGVGIEAAARAASHAFDSQISIYRHDCANLQCMVGNDQSCGDLSAVRWYAGRDEKYYILVHGYQHSTGAFGLSVQDEPSPFGETCDDASLVTLGTVYTGSTVLAEKDVVETCGGFSSSGPGVWFKVEGTGGRLMVMTCLASTNFEARVAVFRGLDCSSLQCFEATYRTCDAHFENRLGFAYQGASVEFDAVAGQVYYFLVHGADESVGIFDVVVEPPTLNFECGKAAALIPEDVLVASSARNALAPTREQPDTCGMSYNMAGIWYSIEGSGGMMTASLHAEFSADMSVYAGECFNPECVMIVSTISLLDDRDLEAAWFATMGVTYYIRIYPTERNLGTFELGLNKEGDVTLAKECAAITSPVSAGFTSTMATVRESDIVMVLPENLPQCGAEIYKPEFWFSVMGTGRRVKVSTCDFRTTVNTRVSVYSGGSCDELSCVQLFDDTSCVVRSTDAFCHQRCSMIPTEFSTATWDTELNQTYFVFIHGKPDALDGFISVKTLELDLLENDECEDAIQIFANATVHVSTTGASIDPWIPRCSWSEGESTLDSPGIWYRVNGTGGLLIASVLSELELITTQITIYNGRCNSLQCAATSEGAHYFGHSQVDWVSEMGMEYTIFVQGINATGEFDMQVYEGNQDLFAASCDDVTIPMDLNTPVAVSTEFGLIEQGLVDFSNGYPQKVPGAWFVVYGTGALLQASTCGLDMDYPVATDIYTGTSCGDLKPEDVRHFDCPFSTFGMLLIGDQVMWHTEPGQRYYIHINGPIDGNRMGLLSLGIDEFEAASNSDCSDATQIQLGQTLAGTFAGAGSDFVDVCRDESGEAAGSEPSVWYHLPPSIYSEPVGVYIELCTMPGTKWHILLSTYSTSEGDCSPSAMTCVPTDFYHWRQKEENCQKFVASFSPDVELLIRVRPLFDYYTAFNITVDLKDRYPRRG